MLLMGNQRQRRFMFGRKWSSKSTPMHMITSVAANRTSSQGTWVTPCELSGAAMAVRSQWPRLITAKLAMKKNAAAKVAITAITCLRAKLLVSRTPCALLNDSIKLTNPDEELQTIPSTPTEKKLL